MLSMTGVLNGMSGADAHDSDEEYRAA
jgi:hypothetical protein